MFTKKSMMVLFGILVISAWVLGSAIQAGAQNQGMMDIMSKFFVAYNTYDIDGVMSLHTDDVVWTWIDPGKNFPNFGPEGKLVGKGKQEIKKLFDEDRKALGFTGYILWSEIKGDTVETIEIWQNDLSRKAAIPVITKSQYRFLGNKIAEWTWITSPESSRRFMEAFFATSQKK